MRLCWGAVINRKTVLTIIFLGPTIAFGLTSKNIERIVSRSGLKKSNLGIVIQTSQGNSIFEVNPDTKRIPASITKLFTSAAVLDGFGPSHKFVTEIWTHGTVKNGRLSGDLYLKGLGDPSFVSEKMWFLVNEFTRTGIKEVTGNLIVDDTYFDAVRFDPGRMPNRGDRAYDAPVGAMSFNWNSTTVHVRPTVVNSKVSVWINPPNEFVRVSNTATTSRRKSSLQVVRAEASGYNEIRVSGSLRAGAKEKTVYKNITNPPLYSGANLKEFLAQRGIEIEGKVKLGTVPSKALLVAQVEGEPVGDLISSLNKFSNNYVAEMLAKNLGKLNDSGPGTMAKGLASIRRYIEKTTGSGSKDFNLSNVSGLTRKNLFTPRQFLSLLTGLKSNFQIYPEFVRSLPISGKDGTLKSRLKDVAGLIRAKTGLLNGVVSLAGYAENRKTNEIVSFVFMYNGSAKTSSVWNLFDNLARELVQ